MLEEGDAADVDLPVPADHTGAADIALHQGQRVAVSCDDESRVGIVVDTDIVAHTDIGRIVACRQRRLALTENIVEYFGSKAVALHAAIKNIAVIHANGGGGVMGGTSVPGDIVLKSFCRAPVAVLPLADQIVRVLFIGRYIVIPVRSSGKLVSQRSDLRVKSGGGGKNGIGSFDCRNAFFGFHVGLENLFLRGGLLRDCFRGICLCIFSFFRHHGVCRILRRFGNLFYDILGRILLRDLCRIGDLCALRNHGKIGLRRLFRRFGQRFFRGGLFDGERLLMYVGIGESRCREQRETHHRA